MAGLQLDPDEYLARMRSQPPSSAPAPADDPDAYLSAMRAASAVNSTPVPTPSVTSPTQDPDAYLAAMRAAAPGQPQQEPQSWPNYIAATGARVALPMAGGIAGAAAGGLAAGPAGVVPGGYAGGVVGASAGEALGEYIEGRELAPREIALEGVLGLIPAGRAASTPLRNIFKRAVTGAATGAASEVPRAYVQTGELPDAKRVALGAGFGAGFGGAVGGAESAIAARAARRPLRAGPAYADDLAGPMPEAAAPETPPVPQAAEMDMPPAATTTEAPASFGGVTVGEKVKLGGVNAGKIVDVDADGYVVEWTSGNRTRMPHETLESAPSQVDQLAPVTSYRQQPEIEDDAGILRAGPGYEGDFSGPPGVIDASAVGQRAPVATKSTLPVGALPAELTVRFPVREIETDAERLQFKMNADREGVTGTLKDAQRFEQKFARPLTLWRDPGSGKVLVVDGHQRLDLARRSGTDLVEARFEDFADAREARIAGGLINIADDKGTAFDAARLLRDMGIEDGEETLARTGMSMRGRIPRHGAALAQLNDGLWRKTLTGAIPEERAVAIGRELPSHEDQDALIRLLQAHEQRRPGAEVSDKALVEMMRDVKASAMGATEGTQVNLFGDKEIAGKLAVERAEVIASIKDDLARDKRLFGYVADSQRAAQLARTGNVIEVDKNQAVATAARDVQHTFETQVRLQGPISDAVNQAASRYARGASINDVKGEALERIREVIPKYLPGFRDSDTLGGASRLEDDGQLSLAERAVRPLKNEQGSAIPIGAEAIGNYVSRDLVPAVRAAVDGAAGTVTAIRRLFNPVGQAPSDSVDDLFKAKGHADTWMFRAEQAEHEAEQYFRRNPNEGIDFIARVQRGEPQRLDAKASLGDKMRAAIGRGSPDVARKQQWADAFREEADKLHAEVSKYKDIAYRRDYFPQLWKRQGDYEKWVTSRRPWEGSKGYFKRRVFDDIEEGIAAGFEPISTNPATLMAAYRYDVLRFVTAQEAWRALGESGRRVWVPHGGKIPDGFASIKDDIARKFFPPDVAKVEINGRETSRRVEAGNWVVEENTARLINNMLSRDLIRETAEGRGALWLNNHLNAIQLGLSAWHAANVSLDSMASETSAAIQRLGMAGTASRQGDVVKAAENLAKSARHALSAATVVKPVASNYLAGRKFFKSGQGSQLEQDLAAGGIALHHRSRYFQNDTWDAFVENAKRGNWIGLPGGQRGGTGALFRLPFAVIDASMKPLFEHAIPRVKVGAFKQLMAIELERNADALASGKMTRETLARNVAANIENRVGELNYDNLFWNQTFKTAAQLTFRAVGFNAGSIRELGGGILQDAPRQVGKLLAGKPGEVELTPKMSYVLGLMLATAYTGAIFHYLHTGEKPEQPLDYYYPKNGEKDANRNDIRIQLPTYFKDFYGVTHHPLRTAINKSAPLPNMLFSILQNRTFFGDYVYDPKAPLSQQAQEVARYLGDTAQPFSFQQYRQLGEGEMSPGKIEAAFGMMKAPRELIETERQQAIRGLLRERGPRTPQQVDLDNRKAKARAALTRGDSGPLEELIASGTFASRQSITQFMKSAGMTPEERMFRMLSKRDRAKVPAPVPPSP